MILYFVNASRMIFRAQRAQMHDRGAAGERAEEADHEIDGVIRGQDAEVAHARAKTDRSR